MPEIYNSDKKNKKSAGKSKKISKNEAQFNGIKSQDKILPVVSNKIKKIHETPGHTHNPFFAYSLYPDKVKFLNADPEEKIILLLRSHPITNLGWILLALIMIAAPSFMSFFSFFELLPVEFQIVIVMIWYLITGAFILERFLIWFFHVNIVTDERILDVDFVSLFFRDMTDANIDQIQDVTVEVGGAIRTLFDFGDVIIQTAAEIPKIKFEAVPKPDAVARILRELRIEEEVEKLEGRVR